MSKPMVPYPPEFRTDVIRLARTSGKPHTEIARELGMTGETLRLWLKQADLDESKRRDGLRKHQSSPNAHLSTKAGPRQALAHILWIHPASGRGGACVA